MALVLTRTVGEVIQIGDEIEVMVTSIRGKKVRIGIKAPLKIPVHRQEVWNAIQRNKELERDDAK